jgi:two-component system cell cycle sensor histidine kinase/response regulator CckA
MSGRELAFELGQKNKDLKVLFMSGYTDDSILPSKFLNTGVHFIRKPFTAASLNRQIGSMFTFASAGSAVRKANG